MRNALVVGINQYPGLEDARTGQPKHLRTPASDAEAIAQLLEADNNFRVRRFPCSEIDGKLQVDPDKLVKAEELSNEITALFLTEDGRNTALLFFAGHGLPKPLGSLKQILLATSHANPRRRKWDGILLRDLWEIVEQSPVQEQIIWLDSCHSGELLEFKESELLRLDSERKRFLIAASHSSEVAYERLDGKHGVLSGALIEGLNLIMPQNKWITDRKLADFVEEKLKADYLKTKLPQNVQIRRPDREINLVLGKGLLNIHPPTQPKPSVVRKIPFVLPQLDVSTFTGREEELTRLEKLLLSPQGEKICSIASVSGIGGIGKSALACHFATIHKDNFPDGVIGLRVDGKEINAIAREFARRCGEEIDLEDERDASTIMQEIFSHRRMLLIFDNAEEAEIHKLRPGGKRCALIFTTRDLGLSISLDIPNEGRINLPVLPNSESLHLLEALIGKVRVVAELEAACDLIQLVGNLPLALQIIGAGLKLNERRSLADYAVSLGEEQRLARLKVRGDERWDLLACFSLSLKHLQPEEIDFFASLSVCAEDGFSRRTAMAASGCEDEYATQELLDYLCRLSLLNYAEVGENRFVFHTLIRLFARELSIERELEQEAAARHAEFLIKFVKSSKIEGSVASFIAEEFNNIVLAAKWLQQQETTSRNKEKKKYNFAIGLQPFFERYGYWKQAVTFMEGFEQLAERNEDWNVVIKFRIQQAKYLSLQGKWSSAETRLEGIPEILSKIEEKAPRQLSEAKWLTTLGGILMRQGRFDEAVDPFKRAANIDEQLGNQEGLAMVLNSLGGLLRRQGNLDEAEDALQRSYVLSEKSNDKSHRGMVLHNLGKVRHDRGCLNEALEVLRRSRTIFEELGHQRSLLMVLTSIGRLLQEQGKFHEAIDAIQRSADIEEQLGDKRNVAIKLNLVGGLFQELGQLDNALEAFEKAVEISQALDDQKQVAIGLNGLAGILQQQGNLKEAAATFQQVVEIGQALDDQKQVAIGLNCLAGVLLQQGNLKEAAATFQQVVEIGQALDDQKQVAIGLNCLAGIFQQQGKLDEAAATFQRSVAIEEKFGNQPGLTMTLISLSRVLRKQGRLEETIETLERIAVAQKELGNQRGEAITLTYLSGVLRQQGRHEEAIQTLDRIFAIDKQLDNQQQQVITLIRLGAVSQQQGNLKDAIDNFERSLELSKEIGDRQLQETTQRALGEVLHHQGCLLLTKKESWNEAEEVLRRSQDIFEELDDCRNLAMVLNSLGGLLRKQEKWKEAEAMLRCGYNLAAEKLKDKRGQAIILNSLGQVLSQQQDPENFKLALMYFRESITLGEELDDQPHLAKVYTAMGQALLSNRETEQAVILLIQGFEIDEKSRNSFGLALVTQDLTCALGKLGRQNEALAYCQRALAIAPKNRKLQELCDRLSSPNIKQGIVKHKRYNSQQGFYWGHITPSDGTPDIYFREGFIDSDCIAQLQPGSIVEVEVQQNSNGPCAKYIRVV
ncbi:tetratricopeptide repeat protein [Microcoleus sp. CAWBG58]|uniref:tetratricopeptide repeat protein n=1 Tax=Microcoleus sp. CAWBG58 TaxID=2841651 RepID=UPI0025D9083D|nr:tetratricopeptide repeat protein [Microcoleus sp. CAWBG58]